MNGLTQFTVLIERRALKHFVKLMTVLGMVFGLLTGQLAVAAPGKGNGRANKVAKDLDDAVEAGITPTQRWAKEHLGQRMVQVVFVSGDTDKDMSGLRSEIAHAGGTVNAAMPGLRMLTATLPAKKVKKVAERSDVKFVSPKNLSLSSLTRSCMPQESRLRTLRCLPSHPNLECAVHARAQCPRLARVWRLSQIRRCG